MSSPSRKDTPNLASFTMSGQDNSRVVPSKDFAADFYMSLDITPELSDSTLSPDEELGESPQDIRKTTPVPSCSKNTWRSTPNPRKGFQKYHVHPADEITQVASSFSEDLTDSVMRTSPAPSSSKDLSSLSSNNNSVSSSFVSDFNEGLDSTLHPNDDLPTAHPLVAHIKSLSSSRRKDSLNLHSYSQTPPSLLLDPSNDIVNSPALQSYKNLPSFSSCSTEDSQSVSMDASQEMVDAAFDSWEQRLKLSLGKCMDVTKEVLEEIYQHIHRTVTDQDGSEDFHQVMEHLKSTIKLHSSAGRLSPSKLGAEEDSSQMYDRLQYQRVDNSAKVVVLLKQLNAQKDTIKAEVLDSYMTLSNMIKYLAKELENANTFVESCAKNYENMRDLLARVAKGNTPLLEKLPQQLFEKHGKNDLSDMLGLVEPAYKQFVKEEKSGNMGGAEILSYDNSEDCCSSFGMTDTAFSDQKDARQPRLKSITKTQPLQPRKLHRQLSQTYVSENQMSITLEPSFIDCIKEGNDDDISSSESSSLSCDNSEVLSGSYSTTDTDFSDETVTASCSRSDSIRKIQTRKPEQKLSKSCLLKNEMSLTLEPGTYNDVNVSFENFHFEDPTSAHVRLTSSLGLLENTEEFKKTKDFKENRVSGQETKTDFTGSDVYETRQNSDQHLLRSLLSKYQTEHNLDSKMSAPAPFDLDNPISWRGAMLAEIKEHEIQTESKDTVPVKCCSIELHVSACSCFKPAIRHLKDSSLLHESIEQTTDELFDCAPMDTDSVESDQFSLMEEGNGKLRIKMGKLKASFEIYRGRPVVLQQSEKREPVEQQREESKTIDQLAEDLLSESLRQIKEKELSDSRKKQELRPISESKAVERLEEISTVIQHFMHRIRIQRLPMKDLQEVQKRPTTVSRERIQNMLRRKKQIDIMDSLWNSLQSTVSAAQNEVDAQLKTTKSMLHMVEGWLTQPASMENNEE